MKRSLYMVEGVAPRGWCMNKGDEGERHGLEGRLVTCHVCFLLPYFMIGSIPELEMPIR